jgi:uncharacterized protein YggT (Ycf19 family)
MALIDFILNVAGTLLWLHWRSIHFDPLGRATPATLAGTLRRIEVPRLRHWQVLGGLVLLLVVRAWVYWQLGQAAGWVPRIGLGFVVLAFRGDYFNIALLYSVLSFIRMLVILYFWLICLTLLNSRAAGADPIQKVIRQHLGWVTRLPWPVVLIGGLTGVTALWLAVNPLLVRAGALGESEDLMGAVRQGLLVSGSLVLTLKYLLPLVLFCHLILNYVYLGTSPVWDYVTLTSRQLLRPLSFLPLRFGKLDLRPLAAAILILLLLDALPNYLLVQYPEFTRRLWTH